MLEAAGSSETSVNIYQITRRNIPQGNLLLTRHRENLKSQQVTYLFRTGFVHFRRNLCLHNTLPDGKVSHLVVCMGQ
jgi:hypothetical protein